ncbi:MAG: chromate transporter [Saprospiraceae bacterium]|jgi:chromate transporter
MEIFKFFFKFGWVAFGGPAAHIALMEEELVKKRKWLSMEEFLDYVGMTNLIPGPNSTEMTMHVGYHRGGGAGLFAAGIGFIFPAFFITLLVAIGYDSIKDIAYILPIISGIKAAVISFIAAAIFKLGKKAAKSTQLIILGILALLAAVLGVNEILVILGAGIFAMMLSFLMRPNQLNSIVFLPLLAIVSTDIPYSKIFLIFLKVGAVLFGSGYVLFAYLDGELINNLGWLTHDDLIEAIAVGQITPGPVLSTATFIGYQLGGIPGALAATFGIFLPSFLFVWLLNPIVHKMRSSKILISFLDAVNIAAVAVMIYVTFEIANSIVVDWKAAVIMTISCGLYFYNQKTSPFLIILLGAVLGGVLSLV